jgi:hypothetical protein
VTWPGSVIIGVMRWVACASVLAACGRIGFDASTENLVVVPAYASAPSWSSWIRTSDPTLPAWAQAEVACSGAEAGFAGCVHAGEMRRAATTLSSCAGLTIADTLGALQWTCVDNGGSVEIVATGLAPGHGLRHLVNASGWIPDAVQVQRNGQVIAASTPAVWWPDPVVVAPSSGASVSLAAAGTIYVIASTQLTNGYSLDADGVSFVVLPGNTLQATPSFATNCSFPGGNASSCLVVASNHLFPWIEGDFDGEFVAQVPVMLNNTTFARVRGVRATSSGSTGQDISVNNSSQCAIVDSMVVEGSQYGLAIYGGHDNAIIGLTASDNGQDGNAGAAGLFVQNTTANTMSRVLAANDSEDGVALFTGAVGNTVAHVTAASTDYDGVYVTDNGNIVAQVAAVNNRSSGIELQVESSGMQLISANNGNGVQTDAAPPELSATIAVGSNTNDCVIYQGGAPTYSCSPIASSASVVTGIDLASSFLAAVTTTDTANASNSNGAAPRSSITDWLHFDDASRAWGEDGPWPGSSYEPCTTNCRIWDLGRTPGDTMLVARTLSGVASADPLVPGQPCPPRLDGANAVMDASSRYFLLGAVELIGDGIGNDDGLCQSGEVCLDLNTAGAHRDEFLTWTATGCVFHDGLVTGVDVRGSP